MRLTFDPTFLTEVANHPDVRPWLGTDGESYVDIAAVLGLPGAFALENEYGGFIFVPKGGGVFEFHTQFLPEGRGRRALEASQDALAILFGAYKIHALETYVPHENRAALGLIRFLGFARTHEDKDQSYWRMTLEGWQARTRAQAA